jgi:hypothetical protein
VDARTDDKMEGLRRSKRKTKVKSQRIIESEDESEEVATSTAAEDEERQEDEKKGGEDSETMSVEEMVKEMATVEDVVKIEDAVKIEDVDAKGKGKAKSTGKGKVTSKAKGGVISDTGVVARVSKRRKTATTPVDGAGESLLHFAPLVLTNSMLTQDELHSPIIAEQPVASTSLAALENSLEEDEEDVIVPTSDNAMCMCFYACFDLI